MPQLRPQPPPSPADDNDHRIAVIGSRSYVSYASVCEHLDAYLHECRLKFPGHRLRLLSGGAPGADALAERYARDRQLPITVLRADWAQHGRSAGPLRNALIAERAHIVFAFWDGSSPGTADLCRKARLRGLEIRIIPSPTY